IPLCVWAQVQSPAGSVPGSAPAPATAPAAASASAVAGTPEPGSVPAVNLTPAANPPTATPPKPPTEAELTLDEATKKVASLPALSAVLEQDVKMLKQAFKVRGKYLKAPGGRIYLELDVL